MKSRLQKTPIAIIGIASVFPDAKNVSEYWTNIIEEVDCIKDVPASRWSIEDYYDPDPSQPDKSYSKRGGFIPDIDFNPMEFGLPPNLLEVTEVSQLLALVLAKEVLRDGGYADADRELKKKIGVILGVGGAQKLMNPLMSRLQYPIWKRVLESVGISDKDIRHIADKIKKAYINWEENSFPGTLGNVVAGRIANRFDLGGTNCVVDAACASSFSGIRMAVHELLDYRSDMMITGGVDTDNSIYAYMCFSKTPALSQKEKSQPFDRNSAGMIIGEGIGMLLLKRLEEAEKDNDRIYAVIKGIGTSSDGKSKSIYAPRPEGQLIALRRAYKDAGIKPQTVGLIEAHGTGTIAGDIAETTALKMLFGEKNSRKQHIGLGSVKSQIGHTKNAAGVAGLIKATMALHHKILPATINIEEPNPKLGLDKSPFYLNTKMRPWITGTHVPSRRAGVSAFGFGGTNFHIVLEEHEAEHQNRYRLHQLAQPIFIHADTRELLAELLKERIAWLESKDAEFHFDQLKKTGKSVELPPNAARLGFVAKHAGEAMQKMESALQKLNVAPHESFWKLKNGVYYRKEGLNLENRIVALFAGQGSPYVNMGRELTCHYPPVRECFRIMDNLFLEHRKRPISEIVYPIPTFSPKEKESNAAQLQHTEHAQPAIGAFSAAQFKIFKQAGLAPTYAAGHSFGELTALWSAGVFGDEDFLSLAFARGQAMAVPNRPNFDAGTMMAVMGKVENLKDDIADFKSIFMANLNSHKQIVLAGPKADMQKVRGHLKNKRYTVVPLPVSAAFHTPLVKHAQKPFSEALEKIKFQKPRFSVYSNSSGKPYSLQAKSIKKRLSEHILNPVRFKEEIENIYQDGGYLFIEFGPQNILTKLTDGILGDKPHISVAINPNPQKDSDRQLREAFVHLKVSGVPLTDIDMYEASSNIEKTPDNALTLQLNGTNYISEKSRSEFEAGLADNYSIFESSTGAGNKAKDNHQTTAAMSVPLKKHNSTPMQKKQTDSPKISEMAIESSLSNFFKHQNKSLRVHEQFLKSQTEYSQSFLQIMLHHTQNGSKGGIAPEVARSISQFHNHQAETLRIHEAYLSNQTEQSRQSFELIKRLSDLNMDIGTRHDTEIPVSSGLPEPEANDIRSQPTYTLGVDSQTTVVSPPSTPESLPPDEGNVIENVLPLEVSTSNQVVVDIVMQVVSEKTGYLSDMLEPDMEVEADLGIDSIKRVEILNAIQEKLPCEVEVDMNAFPELRTLGQIAAAFSGCKTNTTDAAPKRSNPTVPKPVLPAEPSLPVAGNGTVDILLSIISEKTGYLKEMLELDMDLESDLGIDSIKHMEILNDFMEKVPDLSNINTESIVELKTLRQIIEYAGQVENAISSAQTPNAHVLEQGDVTRNGGRPVIAPAFTGISKKANQPNNTKRIADILLSIVSEKTGYPLEMLELNMEMEADLGIDSIKRVEILNGIQEAIPELSQINPDDLSKFTTLAQIVGHVDTGSEKKNPLM